MLKRKKGYCVFKSNNPIQVEMNMSGKKVSEVFGDNPFVFKENNFFTFEEKDFDFGYSENDKENNILVLEDIDGDNTFYPNNEIHYQTVNSEERKFQASQNIRFTNFNLRSEIFRRRIIHKYTKNNRIFVIYENNDFLYIGFIFFVIAFFLLGDLFF